MVGPAGQQINLSYAYSEYLYDNSRGWSKMAALAGSPSGVAGVAIIADSRFPGIFNDWDNQYTGNGYAYPNNWLGRVLLADGSTPRHDGSNFGFADGHVKFYPTGAITCPNRASAPENPIVNPGIT